MLNSYEQPGEIQKVKSTQQIHKRYCITLRFPQILVTTTTFPFFFSLVSFYFYVSSLVFVAFCLRVCVFQANNKCSGTHSTMWEGK